MHTDAKLLVTNKFPQISQKMDGFGQQKANYYCGCLNIAVAKSSKKILFISLLMTRKSRFAFFGTSSHMERTGKVSSIPFFGGEV